MINLVLGKDNSGEVTYGTPFTDAGYNASLAAAGAASLTVPAQANTAIFSFTPGASVYVGTSAITVPSSSFASSNTDLNPCVKSNLIPGSTLYFYAVNASEIQVNFYAGQR